MIISRQIARLTTMITYELSGSTRNIDIGLLDDVIVLAFEHLDFECHITLIFRKLTGKIKFGYCDYQDDEIEIVISSSLRTDEIVRTLFHEIVHAKQFLDGRLCTDGGYTWMGETYDLPYNQRPWEIEAFTEEQKMIDLFYDMENRDYE